MEYVIHRKNRGLPREASNPYKAKSGDAPMTTEVLPLHLIFKSTFFERLKQNLFKKETNGDNTLKEIYQIGIVRDYVINLSNAQTAHYHSFAIQNAERKQANSSCIATCYLYDSRTIKRRFDGKQNWR